MVCRPPASAGNVEIRIKAANADKQRLYLIGAPGYFQPPPVLVGGRIEGEDHANVLVGTTGKPGSDNLHLNQPKDVACDAEGRVYVADAFNNRIQIFTPDGVLGDGSPAKDGQAALGVKFLKTINVERPNLVQVDQKTGSIYVQHLARVEGRSVERLTKYTSFENPAEEFHLDGLGCTQMAVDWWSSKPRIWFGGGVKTAGDRPVYHGVWIFEEDDKTLRLLRNFEWLPRQPHEAEGALERGDLAWHSTDMR